MPRDQKERPAANVRAVDRAIAVLQAFGPDRPMMSALDIQRRVGLSRPTIYRLLETLAAHGFVRAHGEPQRFSLDYAVGQLAQSWLAGLNPVGVGRPFIEKLHEQTRETVSMALLQGQTHLYVLELTSPHALSMSRGIGPKEHLTRGASGKAILAFMSEPEAAAIVSGAPEGCDPEALKRELVAVRARGFAVARGEVIPGVVAMAAPIFDSAGVIGSIVVFGPEVRLPQERVDDVTQQALACARRISAALGHADSRAKIAAG